MRTITIPASQQKQCEDCHRTAVYQFTALLEKAPQQYFCRGDCMDWHRANAHYSQFAKIEYKQQKGGKQ